MIRYLFVFTVTLTGCAQAPEEPTSVPSRQEAQSARSAGANTDSAGSRSFVAFELEWAKPNATELTARIHRMSELMLGRRLAPESFAGTVPEEIPETLGFRYEEGQESSNDAPLHVRYYSGADEVRLANTKLLDDLTPSADVAPT